MSRRSSVSRIPWEARPSEPARCPSRRGPWRCRWPVPGGKQRRLVLNDLSEAPSGLQTHWDLRPGGTGLMTPQEPAPPADPSCRFGATGGSCGGQTRASWRDARAEGQGPGSPIRGRTDLGGASASGDPAVVRPQPSDGGRAVGRACRRCGRSACRLSSCRRPGRPARGSLSGAEAPTSTTPSRSEATPGATSRGTGNPAATRGIDRIEWSGGSEGLAACHSGPPPA